MKEDWQPGDPVSLGRKFANFYRDDQGHFDEIELVNITDPNARMSGLLSGTLQVIGSPETKTAARLAAAHRASSWHRWRRRSISPATCGPTWTPSPMAELRKAVKWGINRQEIVDKILSWLWHRRQRLADQQRASSSTTTELEQREYRPRARRASTSRQAGFDTVDLTLSTSAMAPLAARSMPGS